MIIARWLAALQRRRDARTIERRAIPDALWRLALERYPFLARRDPRDARRLRELATLFLARKEFAGPLEVTDEMAVVIAAQACLPILRLGLHWYDGFVGIVVHADAVRARRRVTDGDGVVHEYDETLAGEAMENGPVMLAWQDVADAGESAAWGYNVVVHEFAHVIDFRAGLTREGAPLDAVGERRRWLAALDGCYERFRDEVDRSGGDDDDDDTLLDPYGAEGLEEYFAVASEAFFVSPTALKEEEPEPYALLQRFYLQDPASEPF